VAGGGALIGTGAFTTVEAERTVNVETAGDASAFLSLTPARSNGNFVDNSSDTIEIDLNGTDSNDGDASGLNQNARTRFADLVQVGNNGTQAITELNLSVSVTGTDNDSAHEDAFKITAGGSAFDVNSSTSKNILTEVDLSSDGGVDELNPGQTVVFGIEIDLLSDDVGIDSIDSGASYTLTIEALTS
jgi:hypothetical protein